MRFAQAIDVVLRGGKVACEGWAAGYYLLVTHDRLMMCRPGAPSGAEFSVAEEDLSSNRWCAVPEHHDFEWAREQLKAGKAVRRASCEGDYLCARTSDRMLSFTLLEIDATDWVLA